MMLLQGPGAISCSAFTSLASHAESFGVLRAFGIWDAESFWDGIWGDESFWDGVWGAESFWGGVLGC